MTALPLLSVEGVDWSWTTWADFIRHGGLSTRRLNIRRFNSHVIAVQAALDGQGIVLGWRSMMKGLVAARRLKAVGGHVMPAPQSFYLTWSMKRPLSADAAVLKDWLLTQLD